MAQAQQDITLTSLLKRISVLEQRLNNQVKGRLKCDVGDGHGVFFELNFKKRIPEYLKKSCALTNQVTDTDIHTIIKLIKNTLFKVLDQFDVQISVFHLEVCNMFDIRVRVHGSIHNSIPNSIHNAIHSTRAIHSIHSILESPSKSQLYEEIEQGIKTHFGDIFLQVPFAENMYDPHQLHFEKKLRVYK